MSAATMFSRLPTIEAHVRQLIDEQKYDDALANVVVGVHNHYKSPGIEQKFLYYPELDQQLARMSAALEAQNPPSQATRGPGNNTLVIATELYVVGGHSKVVQDILAEVESPTLVLTDVFGNYRREPAHLLRLFELFQDVNFIVLPQPTLWGMSRALLKLTQRLNPQAILYIQHHQDPIPFVGTLRHLGSRKSLVHHCDTNPSLGCTLPGVTHVDLTDELAAMCGRNLGTQPSTLPLFVPDSGCKTFPPVEGRKFAVVTAGTHIKYLRSGELALANIASRVLQSIDGDFIHIGPMDEAWQNEIRKRIQEQGLDPARFKPLGPVASLWDTLLELDAHVYLGSAPIAGGRGAVEAQGCGYPVVFHRVADPTLPTNVDSIYADKTLCWTTLDDLSAVLSAMMPRLADLSALTRRHFEQHYSREEFRRKLGRLSQLNER